MSTQITVDVPDDDDWLQVWEGTVEHVPAIGSTFELRDPPPKQPPWPTAQARVDYYRVVDHIQVCFRGDQHPYSLTVRAIPIL